MPRPELRPLPIGGFPPRLGVWPEIGLWPGGRGGGAGEIALEPPRGAPAGDFSHALKALAAALAALAAMRSLNDPQAREKLAELQRQRARRIVQEQTPAASAMPPLPPDEEDKIKRAAAEVGVSRERLEALARDPSHGWNMTENSIEEARIAARLENSGRLKDLVRDPTGASEFIEDGGAGARWDVKSFRAEGFDKDYIMSKISEEVGNGENVIINEAHLTPMQVTGLRQAVAARGWAEKVIFATP